jgi:hypothetical protein
MIRSSDNSLTLREQLLEVAGAFAAARGHVSLKRVSTLIFNEGKKLDRLAEGRDLETGSFERAMLWLSQNWPENAEWPVRVPRPVARSEVA